MEVGVAQQTSLQKVHRVVMILKDVPHDRPLKSYFATLHRADTLPASMGKISLAHVAKAIENPNKIT